MSGLLRAGRGSAILRVKPRHHFHRPCGDPQNPHRQLATHIFIPTNAHSDFPIHCASFDVDPVWHAVYSATSGNKRIFTEAPSMTLTSMFACDMCKTLAQNTRCNQTDTLDRIVVVIFICDLVRFDLMNRVRDSTLLVYLDERK